MKYKHIFNPILFLTIPSMVLPQPVYASPPIQISEPAIKVENEQGQSDYYSWDDILDLIEELEDDELEKTCTEEELEKINRLLVFLAKEGVLPHSEEAITLQSDIEKLLHPEVNPYEYLLSFEQRQHSVPIPSLFSGQPEMFLCKNWFKKRWDQTKDFVKQHKTEIIIGAIVVVAVSVVIVAVVAASSVGVATAAGMAGAAAASGSDKEEKKTSTPSSIDIPSTLTFTDDTPHLQETFSEQISLFKKQVMNEDLLSPSIYSETYNDRSFGERAREIGAFLAHRTLEEIAEIGAYIPRLNEEINEFGAQFFPESLPSFTSNFQTSPMENYENLLASGHQKIDRVFSTDQAEYYRIKEDKKKFAIGIIPLPGALGVGGAATSGRIPITAASSVRGWKIGEPYTNRTIFGTIPKWSTVRRRYWKNRAYLHSDKYKPHELERMKKGLAPQRISPRTNKIESKELHHDPAQRDGGRFDFIEVWPDEHARIDSKRHLGG